MASSRPRPRQPYPYANEENSASDTDTELDEEHQERLIATLAATDARKTALYRTLFLAIPALAALVTVPALVFGPTPRHRWTALLSITSFSCTAYILHFLRVERVARKGKTAVYKIEAAKGPVEKYLVYLNGGLAGLLMVAAAVSGRKGSGEETWTGALPAIILGLTLFVREQLAPVDLEELEKARYELKGA